MKKLLSKKNQLTQCYALSFQSGKGEAVGESKIKDFVSITAGLTPQIAKVLYSYVEIFQEPKGLPPHRIFYHKIQLKEGAQPICLRPYRYNALQKDIIKKLTQKLLDSRVIQISHS